MVLFVQRLVSAFIVSHMRYFMDSEERKRAVVFRYRKKLWGAVEAVCLLDNGTQHAKTELERSCNYKIEGKAIVIHPIPIM